MTLRVRWHHHLAGALVAALVFNVGSIARAQEDVEQEEGQIIQIGPDRNAENEQPRQGERRRGFAIPSPNDRQTRRELPRYWIGIVGGPLTPLVQHHVDLEPGKGLLVRDVVPESPAAQAGLQQFDVMVRANDTELDDMQDLIDLVLQEGENQGQIDIEILRHGQRETVWVSPAERPADLKPFGDRPPWGGNLEGFGGDPSQVPQQLRGLLDQFGVGGDPGNGWQFRQFGPGVVVGGQSTSIAQLPNGVSVKVEKQSDGPARITVERDGQTWTIDGEDPEALEQLPDDLRPFVERMLGQQRQKHQWNLENGLPEQFQQHLPKFDAWPPKSGQGNAELRQRLEQMEQQMSKLQERLLGPTPDRQQESQDNSSLEK